MSAFGDYLENAGLDHFLGVSALAMPSVFLHLYTTVVNDADTGTEVVGNGYVAQAIGFNGASGGAADNSGQILFPEASGNWGTITHFALKDGSGNLLYHGAFTVSKLIETGDVAVVDPGALVVNHD